MTSYFGPLAVALGVAAVIAFFILKRVVKWAVRLGLLVVALSLMGTGGLAWWWNSRSEEKPKPKPQAQEPRKDSAARPEAGAPAEAKRPGEASKPAARPNTGKKATPQTKKGAR
jgi:uncharacterized membrane protein YqiK